MGKRLLFCFLGVDGSGKTTAALELQKKLEADGFKTRYLRLDYFLLHAIPPALRRRAGNPLLPISRVKSEGEPEKRAPKKPGRATLALLQFVTFLHLVDSLAAYLFRIKLRLGKPIIIFDRYYYDFAVLYLDKCPGWLRWCYTHLIPTPTAIFLMDVAPEIAELRDGEYPPEFYSTQTRAYLEFTRSANLNVRVINNIDSLRQQTATEIYAQARKKIREQRNG